jgi:Mg2+ and Co2+ transporter CorA
MNETKRYWYYTDWAGQVGYRLNPIGERRHTQYTLTLLASEDTVQRWATDLTPLPEGISMVLDSYQDEYDKAYNNLIRVGDLVDQSYANYLPVIKNYTKGVK